MVGLAEMAFNFCVARANAGPGRGDRVQVAGVVPGITKKDCALVVDGFLNAVKRALANGDHIEIRGFGTFKVRKRKSRMARNPRTGDAVRVPSRSVPVFKPSKHFQARVARSQEAGD